MSCRLIDSALTIWQSGVNAVLPERLIETRLAFSGEPAGSPVVTVCGEAFPLRAGARVIVVGMGKASGAMAAGAEKALAPLIEAGRLSGWVNLPVNALTPLRVVHAHAGRPAGMNEPTDAGVAGTREIARLIESAGPDDLILALISGGGSALAPLPIPEITLEKKALVTRLLSGAGANIVELNTVRKQLSRIKGGGMRRMARGRRLVALILSDVLGDPLDVIASGATVADTSTPADALNVLRRFGLADRADLSDVVAALRKRSRILIPDSPADAGYENHRNLIVGNNRLAVDAACRRAEQLGFRAVGESAPRSEEDVGEVAERLIGAIERQRAAGTPTALISGGEPTVTLAPPEIRGEGGRNTQLVLLALIEALRNRKRFPARFIFLSAGTDGEDGPTDAAGAYFDDGFVGRGDGSAEEILAAACDAARRNDAYTFFQRFGGLFRPGATGTNVCDLRVLLVGAELAEGNRSR